MLTTFPDQTTQAEHYDFPAGAPMAYAYDALNRLASVTNASGATSYSYMP